MLKNLFNRKARLQNFCQVAASMRERDVLRPEYLRGEAYAHTYAEVMLTHRKLGQFFAANPEKDLRHCKKAAVALLQLTQRVREMRQAGELAPAVAAWLIENTDAWGRRMGLVEMTQVIRQPVKRRPLLWFLIPQYA